MGENEIVSTIISDSKAATFYLKTKNVMVQ